MKSLMENLFAFYCFCSRHVEFDPRDIATCTRRACLQYGALRSLADARGEDVWRPKPKLHMWQELAEYQAASLGNPKHFWAYKDEDFMGLIAELGHRRGGRSAASTLPSNVFKRYRALSYL